MLKFHIITLFPELIDSYCAVSMMARGIQSGAISVNTYNPRDFCLDKYRKVDDTPYGGGAGMVLKPEPVFAAFEAIVRPADSPVLLLSPQGSPFKQALANELCKQTDLTLLCGHYEGFDERIRSIASHEVSLGDFVLTGGELPALAVMDATARLVPGVLGKLLSIANESFIDGLLEGPAYTKPPLFRDMEVPAVLRSGDHGKIEIWRRQQSLKRTFERRPDLLETAPLTAQDRKFLRTLGDK